MTYFYDARDRYVATVSDERLKRFLMNVFDVARASYALHLNTNAVALYRNALHQIIDAVGVCGSGLPPLTLRGVLLQQGIRGLPEYNDVRLLPRFDEHVHAVAQLGMQAGMEEVIYTV